MILRIIKYLFFFLMLISISNFSYAQTYPIYKNIASIAVLDQDSLFSDSDWGKKILENVETEAMKLAAENRLIESSLEIEELELTKSRKTLTQSEFDILAFDFDKKVKKIRTEQSDKQLKINIFLNQNKKLFFEKITPILLSFIDELGVEVLLNKDTVALASTGSDITKAAIVKINSQLKN